MPYKNKARKRAYDREYQRKRKIMLEAAELYLASEVYEAPPLDPIPKLKGDDFGLFSDPHCPYHSKKWMGMFIKTCIEEEQEIGICVGDLFDWVELTNWHTFGSPMGSWSTLKSGLGLLKALKKTLKTLHVLCGNHDVRALREMTETKFKKSQEMWWNILNELTDDENIIWHKHTNMILETSCGDYLLCHPSGYSRNAPTVEKALASIHHMHTIGTHGHLWAVSFDVSSKYLCAQIGHCSDRDKQEYPKEKLTTHPNWMNGYATIKDGKFKPFADHPAWRN